jgi:hypothetical protein
MIRKTSRIVLNKKIKNFNRSQDLRRLIVIALSPINSTCKSLHWQRSTKIKMFVALKNVTIIRETVKYTAILVLSDIAP